MLTLLASHVSAHLQTLVGSVPVATGSPRFTISRLADANSATEWIKSRISICVKPASFKARMLAASNASGARALG